MPRARAFTCRTARAVCRAASSALWSRKPPSFLPVALRGAFKGAMTREQAIWTLVLRQAVGFGGSGLPAALDVMILSERPEGAMEAKLTIQKLKDDASDIAPTAHLSRIVLGHDCDGDEVSILAVTMWSRRTWSPRGRGAAVRRVEVGAPSRGRARKRHRRVRRGNSTLPKSTPSKFEQSPNGTSAKATSTGSPRRRMRSMSVGTAMSFAPGGVSGRPFRATRQLRKRSPAGARSSLS